MFQISQYRFVTFLILGSVAGSILVEPTIAVEPLHVRIDELIRVWDPSSWYFPYVLAGLIVYLVPMFYGFFVSLGDRRLFNTDLLDG